MKFVIVLPIVLSVLLLGHAQDEEAPACNANEQRRIIGGKDVIVKNFKYMASLIINGTPSRKRNKKEYFVGGATIIAERWAVTAAHCVQYLTTPTDFIAGGQAVVRGNSSYWLAEKDEYYYDHKVELAVMHEWFDDDTHDYNIALVKVQKRFYGLYEYHIQLPAKNYLCEPDVNMTVFGWSTTIPELRAVIVKTVDYFSCFKSYAIAEHPERNPIRPHMICAAGLRKDDCLNDFGGALVDGNTLVGLVSWGVDCANKKRLGVYTKISHVLKWINRTMKKDEEKVLQMFLSRFNKKRNRS